jgi:DNA polymerase II small subunit/DNA polymerase delta subunit B
MVLDKNFKEFIELLNVHNVKYLVIGGYAVNFHGYPRYTKDIDFWIWQTKLTFKGLY